MPLDPTRPARLALIYLLARHTPLPVQAVKPAADAMLADIESGFVSGLRAEEGPQSAQPSGDDAATSDDWKDLRKALDLGPLSSEHERIRGACAEIAALRSKLAEACKSDSPALALVEEQRDRLAADLRQRDENQAMQETVITKLHADLAASNGIIGNYQDDLAAARESERAFRAEVEAGFRKHGLAAGPTAIDRLVEDLAAEREKSGSLDNSLGQCAAQLAAANERAEKAEADARHEKRRADGREYVGKELARAQADAARWHEASRVDRGAADGARAEADAAKAELAALRQQIAGFQNLDAMRQSMVDTADENKALKAELHVAKLSVSNWHADAERLSEELAALKQSLISQVRALTEKAKDRFEKCGSDGLTLQLESDSRAAAELLRAAGVEVEE